MNKLRTDQVLKNYLTKKQVILTKIANNSVNYFQDDVFNSQGAALGSKWKPSKRALKKGGKTLQITGRGLRSISANFVSKDKVEIKPGEKYMEYHQVGAGNNPKREFMGNSKELLNKNFKTIIKELEKI